MALKAALQSDDAAGKLAELGEAMKHAGLSQLEIYRRFHDRFLLTHDDPNQKNYDALADTMDLIWGYCEPQSRLFSRSLSDEEIEKYRQSRNETEAQS